MSEINLMRTIIHFKKFDLLTHPVCELFLHLKWKRARALYWAVNILYLLFTMQVLTYSLLNYGELGHYLHDAQVRNCTNQRMEEWFVDGGSLGCLANPYLVPPLLVTSALVAMIFILKIIRDRQSLLSWRWWHYRPEDLMPMFVVILLICDSIDSFRMPIYGPDVEPSMSIGAHKVISAFLVWGSCRTMMQTIARDPDIAMFVEMMAEIQSSLLKFLGSYIWLFIGWIITFHILIGNDDLTAFRDIGSASAKVLAMFTGEIGFEAVFKTYTRISEPSHGLYNFFVIVFFTVFIIEMCVILMNLIIGVSISNIQDLKENADGLRLVKEVVLQGYMESFLRIAPNLPNSCGYRVQDLSQLVTKDIYNGNAFYSFDHNAIEGVQQPILQLVKKIEAARSSTMVENTLTNLTHKKIHEIPIPYNVVAKLRQNIQADEVNRRAEDHPDLKKTLNDIKNEITALKSLILKASDKKSAENKT